MSRGNLNNRFFAAVLGSILIVFLAAVALILFSNLTYLARSESPDGDRGLSLFPNALRDPETHFAMKLSFVSAVLTTLLSLVVGIPAAYVLSRYRLRISGIIDTILDLPIVLPPPVMGISLLVFFNTATGRWHLPSSSKQPLRSSLRILCPSPA